MGLEGQSGSGLMWGSVVGGVELQWGSTSGCAWAFVGVTVLLGWLCLL